MQFHEIANIFPIMNEQEFVELKADIQEQGLLEPIVTYEGKILDGRNRFMACNELGIEPEFVPYTGNTPLHYVVSKNLKRRHLTAGQKAFVGAEIEKQLAELARKNLSTHTEDGYRNSAFGETPKAIHTHQRTTPRTFPL